MYDEWPGDQWAVRVEQTGRAVDWSVVVFRRVAISSRTSVSTSGAGAAGDRAGIRLSHHRVRVVGADMAANVGRFALRAEGAYVDTEDAGGAIPSRRTPSCSSSSAPIGRFASTLNLNVQYLYRYVVRLSSARRRSSSRRAIAIAASRSSTARRGACSTARRFRVAHKWLHDTLEAECAAAGFFGPRGLTIRPKIAYALTDHWKVLVGAEVYRGESSSVFGLLRPNTATYLRARWSF